MCRAKAVCWTTCWKHLWAAVCGEEMHLCSVSSDMYPLHCAGNERIAYVAGVAAVLTHCAQQHEGLCCSWYWSWEWKIPGTTCSFQSRHGTLPCSPQTCCSWPVGRREESLHHLHRSLGSTGNHRNVHLPLTNTGSCCLAVTLETKWSIKQTLFQFSTRTTTSWLLCLCHGLQFIY